MKKTEGTDGNEAGAGTSADNDLRVLSSDDDKIKAVGEVLANDSSRTILRALTGVQDMTINQISQEIDLSIPLVSHHIKKMQDVGIVKISRMGMSVKGQKMKYYAATNRSFLITPPERQANSIVSSLRKFARFAAIGMAGLVSWATLNPTEPKSMQAEKEKETGEKDTVLTADESGSSFVRERQEPAEVAAKDSKEVTMQAEQASESRAETKKENQGMEEHASQAEVQEFADTSVATLDNQDNLGQFPTSATDAIEPAVLSVIIPIAVMGAGILLERALTRLYYSKRKAMRKENSA